MTGVHRKLGLVPIAHGPRFLHLAYLTTLTFPSRLLPEPNVFVFVPNFEPDVTLRYVQDESVIPPSLAKALDRVRQGADVMPTAQLYRQLEKSLGVEWRSRLKSFDETPIAAASIGQVSYLLCQNNIIA